MIGVGVSEIHVVKHFYLGILVFVLAHVGRWMGMRGCKTSLKTSPLYAASMALVTLAPLFHGHPLSDFTQSTTGQEHFQNSWMPNSYRTMLPALNMRWRTLIEDQNVFYLSVFSLRCDCWMLEGRVGCLDKHLVGPVASVSASSFEWTWRPIKYQPAKHTCVLGPSSKILRSIASWKAYTSP